MRVNFTLFSILVLCTILVHQTNASFMGNVIEAVVNKIKQGDHLFLPLNKNVLTQKQFIFLLFTQYLIEKFVTKMLVALQLEEIFSIQSSGPYHCYLLTQRKWI